MEENGDKRLLENERWEAHRREHVIHEKAHEREHFEYNTRIDAAKEAQDERLDTMNKFRTQIEAERALYVQRDMLEEYKTAARAAVDTLDGRVQQLEQDRSNLQGRFWAVGLIVALVVLVINATIAFLI